MSLEETNVMDRSIKKIKGEGQPFPEDSSTPILYANVVEKGDEKSHVRTQF